MDYLVEIGSKGDDGHLFKIYEKYRERFSKDSDEIEVVLSTMHKVKGLEFDCVVVPPSFSNLPLKDIEYDEEQKLLEIIEEERRLTYVAYTRARFRLLVFKNKREIAMNSFESFRLPDDMSKKIGVPAMPELSKLQLSWAAKEYNYPINQKMKSQIKSGDPVVVQKKVNGQHVFFDLHHGTMGNNIGSISSTSAKDLSKFNRVPGFVVNEVVVWTYEDSQNSDRRNGTFYSNKWCSEAIKQGYVYVVDFAGYGKGE